VHDLLKEVYPYLVGFFLLDCLLYVRAGRTAFVSADGRRFRVLGAGLHLLPPWPTARAVVADERLAGVTGDGPHGPGPVASPAPPIGLRWKTETDRRAVLAASAAAWAAFFVLVPFAAYRVPAPAALLGALAAFGAAFATAVWLANRSLRRAGVARRERLGALSTVLAFPPSACHLLAVIERDGYRGAAVPVVAAALLDRDGFLAFSADRLRRIRAMAVAEGEAGSAGVGAGQAQAALIERLLRDRGSSAAEVLSSARHRVDPVAAAWCPNCLADYRAGVETCTDCRLALERYA
jgi:hypothetical protein